MRAFWLLLIALEGCGRIAFDPRTDGGGDGSAVDSNADSAPLLGTGVYLASSLTGLGSEIFSVDVTTGQLQLIGVISDAANEINGLAFKDNNTLYATTVQGALWKVTLSPFGHVQLQTGLGSITGLELDGTNTLVAVDESADTILSFQVEPYVSQPSYPLVDTVSMMSVDAAGGDIIQFGDAEWDVWTNNAYALYRFDRNTGNGSIRGSPATVQTFITGLVEVNGVTYGVSHPDDSLFVIDRDTSQLGAATPLCLSCPTPYDIRYGDMTAAPGIGD